MRILHVVPSIDPATGGPAAVALRLAAGQAQLGHQTLLCSYVDPSQSAAIAASFNRIPGIDRVERIDLPLGNRAERMLAIKARERLHQLVPSVDWVYLHCVWNPIIKAAADASQRHAKPYFLLPHGMLDPWSLSQKRWRKRIALLLGYRRMLDRAAALHVLNQDEKQLIVPLGLAAPSVVIPNGVFEEELVVPGGVPSFFAMHPEVGEQPFILFLGRLHQKKGLDVLAEAFAIVAREDQRVRVVVAGPDENAAEDFDRRIALSGLSARVHRIGAIYGDAKIAAYKAATVFCLPSRQEGFSLAVTEALALGLPVVITPGVHFPEVAESGAGKVVALDAKAVADGLLEILRDPEKARRMGEAGRALVSSRYTWRRIAEQSIAAFERLARR
jgi:glycosyltransferase involved in cell wall biosynthesis